MAGTRGSIVVRGLHKQYPMFVSPGARLASALGFGSGPVSRFSALQDVNFSVEPGETIGILGFNGAGKSTLLGILCGVISPTEGTVEVNGRVTSILELGAGFNPEWTGRQNAEFYGILQGLGQEEAKARIPDIEKFADIGQYFDQPTRTYSSGMLMRVAFSSAICADPDILIVDEAIAVGDSRFQNKCFQEFEKFKKAGKTIVLVTQSAELVVQHCTRSIVLNQGQIVIDGEPAEGMNYYLNSLYAGNDQIEVAESGDEKDVALAEEASRETELEVSDDVEQRVDDFKSAESRFDETVDYAKFVYDKLPERVGYNSEEYRFGNKKGYICDVALTMNGHETLIAQSGTTMKLGISAVMVAPVEVLFYGLNIKTKENLRVYGTTSAMQGQFVDKITKPTQIEFEVSVPLNLPQGEYFIDCGIGETVDDQPVVIDIRVSCLSIHVSATPWCNGVADLSAKFNETSRKDLVLA